MTTPSDPGAALTQLLDERAIMAVLVRYARGADGPDIALMRTCYHPDATDNRSGDGTATGLLDTLDERMAKYLSTMHTITNVDIDVEGDQASVRFYSRALHLLPGDDAGPVTIERNGRYLDRFERRDGEWRIADRQLTRTWVEQRVVVGES